MSTEKKGFLNLGSVVSVALIRQHCLHLCKCGDNFSHPLGAPSTDIHELLAMRCNKTLTCETCFIKARRQESVKKIVLANGRRFRYTVPASSLKRIPLGGSR
jgi:hypothetical protein